MRRTRQLRVRNVASTGSNVWSASRYSANGAWYSVGSGGFAGSSYVCNAFGALPVALLDIRDSEL